jgi:hypothetical protein
MEQCLPIPLSSPIEVRDLPDGWRYILPRRKAGRAWLLLGLNLVVLEVIVTLVCAGAVVWSIAKLAQQAGPLMPWDFLIAFWWLPIILFCAVGMHLFLSILLGHLEIEMRKGRLRASECLWPVRWSSSCAMDRVFSLTILGAPEGLPWRTLAALAHECWPGRLGRLWASLVPNLAQFRFLVFHALAYDPTGSLAVIVVRHLGRGPVWLVGGYPHSWLVALATDLVSRWQAEQAPLGSKSVVPVVEAFCEDFEDVDRKRPPGCRAILEEYQDGFLLSLPRSGFWRSGWAHAKIGGQVALVPFAVIIPWLFRAGPSWGLLLSAVLFPMAVFCAAIFAGGLALGRRGGHVAIAGGELLLFDGGCERLRQGRQILGKARAGGILALATGQPGAHLSRLDRCPTRGLARTGRSDQRLGSGRRGSRSARRSLRRVGIRSQGRCSQPNSNISDQALDGAGWPRQSGHFLRERRHPRFDRAECRT